jgi:PhnB protein
MRLNTYVNFKGCCAEAFRFYEQHLGGKTVMMMRRGDHPDQSEMDEDSRNAVVHARILIGGIELFGADVDTALPMRSAYLTLSLSSDYETERIYAALSDGGEIFMPIQETFYASRFAQLRDRFGINWMLLCER